MNQKLIIGIVAVIIVAVGVGIYSSNNSKTEMMEKEVMMQKEKEAMLAKENSAMVEEKNKEAMMQKEKDTAMIAEKEAMMKKDTGTMTPKTDAMMKVGSYEAYSSEKIRVASATDDVVLFFRASWCPTCKAVDADIKAHLKEIPASLTILDVNYDNSTDLKKKYGVTYQHTFVQVDAQGNLIKKWSGSPTLASLVSEVK